MPLPADHEERAVYVVQGKIDIVGDTFEPGQLLVFRPGDEITITALEPARLMLLGGEPMDGPRHIWWNFVSSSKERIEQAKATSFHTNSVDLIEGCSRDNKIPQAL